MLNTRSLRGLLDKSRSPLLVIEMLGLYRFIQTALAGDALKSDAEWCPGIHRDSRMTFEAHTSVPSAPVMHNGGFQFATTVTCGRWGEPTDSQIPCLQGT